MNIATTLKSYTCLVACYAVHLSQKSELETTMATGKDLYFASRRGDVKKLKHLIDLGANVNWKNAHRTK